MDLFGTVFGAVREKSLAEIAWNTQFFVFSVSRQWNNTVSPPAAASSGKKCRRKPQEKWCQQVWNRDIIDEIYFRIL